MRESPADASVLLMVGVEDRGRRAADGPHELRRLAHFTSGAMGVDILPGLRVGEGEMVRADADDGPVVGVESMGVEGLAASGMEDCPWEARDAMFDGAWKVPERV